MMFKISAKTLNACLILVFALVLFADSNVFSKEVRTIKLNNKEVAKIKVSPRGTILSFPTKPSKVILGSRGAFGLEYVENDIAISCLGPKSHSNMFVYLEGRRFSFDLVASETNGDQIILIRDDFESTIQVKIK